MDQLKPQLHRRDDESSLLLSSLWADMFVFTKEHNNAVMICPRHIKIDTFLLIQFYTIKHYGELEWYWLNAPHVFDISSLKLFGNWIFCAKDFKSESILSCGGLLERKSCRAAVHLDLLRVRMSLSFLLWYYLSLCPLKLDCIYPQGQTHLTKLSFVSFLSLSCIFPSFIIRLSSHENGHSPLWGLLVSDLLHHSM